MADQSTDKCNDTVTNICNVVHSLLTTNTSLRSHVAKLRQITSTTSGYATWFTAGRAIRIAHYDVIDAVITRKLQQIEKTETTSPHEILRAIQW